MKTKITENNYKQIVLKRAIISCWILLAICFFIKIFGGNFFNIVCNNEKFINFCTFIDTNWLYFAIAFMFYYTSTMIYILAVTRSKFTLKNFLLITACCICSYSTKFISTTIGLIADYVLIYFGLCLYLALKNGIKPKKAILLVLFGFVLNNVFQLISLFVKDLGLFKIMVNNSLIQIIFMLDYYIMLVLAYLYVIQINNKEK